MVSYCLDLWEVWSHNFHLPPVGAANEHKTEIFEFTSTKVQIWVLYFHIYFTLYFYCTTFPREILYLLLHYIYLTAM